MFKFTITRRDEKNKPLELVASLEQMDATAEHHWGLYNQIRSRAVEILAEQYVKEHKEELIANMDMKALSNLVLAKIAKQVDFHL